MQPTIKLVNSGVFILRAKADERREASPDNLSGFHKAHG
jgi:hypothetical protein